MHIFFLNVYPLYYLSMVLLGIIFICLHSIGMDQILQQKEYLKNFKTQLKQKTFFF